MLPCSISSRNVRSNEAPPTPYLRSHIHLSTCIFSAFNGHMQVIFRTMLYLQYNEAAMVYSILLFWISISDQGS